MFVKANLNFSGVNRTLKSKNVLTKLFNNNNNKNNYNNDNNNKDYNN